MKAIQVKETGGPEQMQVVDIPVPQPGPKEALVKIAASGVNFIDVYFRTGLYKADLPLTLGMEAPAWSKPLGRTCRKSGRAIAWPTRWRAALMPSTRWCPSWQLVKVPDGTELKSAAAAMLQGMTAHYLTHSTYSLKSGPHLPGPRRGWTAQAG